MRSVVFKAFLDGLAPDPELSVSEWADNYRVLTTTSSSEPGLFRTSRIPYAKEVMDCLTVTNPAQEIIVQKGAQLGPGPLAA